MLENKKKKWFEYKTKKKKKCFECYKKAAE
jgi:hypothetical protein